MITKREYKVTGAVFFSFILLLMVGWFVLMGFFEFPDILRKSPIERFNLFQKNQGVIVPAYYVMSITAILQVYMAVAMYHLTKKGRMLDLVALTSGILAGIFQVLGFFRWVILIPMLSSSLNSKEVSLDVVFFLEKFANTYLGMTVGEHLGTFFLAIWLLALCSAMMKTDVIDRKLSALGVVSGVAMLIASYENISSSFSFIGELIAALWGLYLVWVLIMSIAMFRKKDESTVAKVHWTVWLMGVVFYLANVIPSFM